MNIVSLILALLKFVNNLMNMVEREKFRQDGRNEEIARAAESIHRKTEAGKKIWEKVDAMSEKEVDDALRNLEPRPPPR